MTPTAWTPVPLLARIASSRLLGDLAGGAAILAVWLVLWSWFALAVFAPSRALPPPDRAPAVAKA
jgi:hypothetical protein